MSLNDDQLDALEEQGYLDPGFRGAGDDEAEAFEACLADTTTDG